MTDEELLAELENVTQGEVLPQVDMKEALRRWGQCGTCDYLVRLTCAQTAPRNVHALIMCKGEGYTCPVGRW